MSSEFRIRQHREDDHEDDAPHFIYEILPLIIHIGIRLNAVIDKTVIGWIHCFIVSKAFIFKRHF